MLENVSIHVRTSLRITICSAVAVLSVCLSNLTYMCTCTCIFGHLSFSLSLCFPDHGLFKLHQSHLSLLFNFCSAFNILLSFQLHVHVSL